MAQAATNQQLIRDIINLMSTRGFRHAIHKGDLVNGAEYTDNFAIYAHTSGNLSAPAAGVQRIVIDFTTSELTTLDEKGHGSLHPHVPDSSRQ